MLSSSLRLMTAHARSGTPLGWKRMLRLESRHTHKHADGAKVKSLCFVEGTHTFLSGADDGSIHAIRIEYKSVEGGESSRYGKPTLVRDYQIPFNRLAEEALGPQDTTPEPEYAVWLHHYRTGTSQSILLAATNKCRILAIDLKNMEIIHTMNNPVPHGTPTTFCVDKKHHWLLMGTSHGILDLWDLRFKLRLRSIGIQTSSRIDRILIHPTKGHGRWVMVSAGGEITVWDIEKLVCREVLRTSTFVVPSHNASRPYETYSPDDEVGEKILARLSRDIDEDSKLNDLPRSIPNETSGESTNKTMSTALSPSSESLPILAMYILHDYLQNSSQPENPNKSALLFTGGADRGLRYWDIAHPEKSLIISGPMIYTDEGKTIKPNYEVTHPLSLNAGAQIALVEEKFPEESTNVAGSGSARGTPKKPSRRDHSGQASPAQSGRTTPSATPSGAQVRSRTHECKTLCRNRHEILLLVLANSTPYGHISTPLQM